MKTVLIIGASSGIGAGLSKIYDAHGYNLALASRRLENLQEIKEQCNGKCAVFQIDITQLNSLDENLNHIASELNDIDLIILTAGVGDINLSLDSNIAQATLDVNVKGFTMVINWAFHYFCTVKKGHIVAVTSIAGLISGFHSPEYNASKAYQINFLKCLRKVIKSKRLDIEITDVRPGLVNTNMAKGDNLKWVIPVEKVAKQIFSAINSNRNVVYVSRRWGFLATLLRLID